MLPILVVLLPSLFGLDGFVQLLIFGPIAVGLLISIACHVSEMIGAGRRMADTPYLRHIYMEGRGAFVLTGLEFNKQFYLSILEPCHMVGLFL